MPIVEEMNRTGQTVPREGRLPTQPAELRMVVMKDLGFNRVLHFWQSPGQLAKYFHNMNAIILRSQ